jgi:peptidoglycan/LPS O-acetylase OafA/YrhL
MASTETLGTRSRGRDNAFDVLRLLGATLVLMSHSFVLAGVVEPKLGDSSLGVLGVEIFFTISGFLVTASWLSDPRLRAFLAKRALRILPALVATLAVCAFLLGPLLSTLGAGSYLGGTGMLSYVVDNVVAVVSAGTVKDVSYVLPGVFTDNPTDSINGSLWTLPVEVRAYVLVLGFGLFGILTRWLWPAVLAGLALVVAGAGESTLLIVMFLVASLMYVHRDRIPLRGSLAMLALAAWLVCVWFPQGAVVVAVSVPYLVLFVAYTAPAALRRLTRRGDISYGVYLIAFPVQQTVVLALGPDVPVLVVIALSLPVTFALAILSWRFVEKPALRLKRVAVGARGGTTRLPDPQPEPSQPIPALS